MSTRLIQVVAFANVAPAATVNLPHSININGTPKRPDFVAADASGFTIAVTATQVSVTNNGVAPASINVWLELKHTIPRELGAAANLVPQPFIAATGSSGGGSVPTDGGEAGLVGAGTGLDPIIPVAGPFRPVDQVFVMDDYHVSYGPQPGGVPTTLGVGYTSILKSAGGSTQFSCNLAAGYLGPGVGSMMGVMDLQLIGANASEYLTATQARPGDDSGSAIDLAKLQGTWDLWYGARVSFESTNNFEGNQKAYAGFSHQIDTPTFGNPERAYFHPKDNGSQVNWFANYNIGTDLGAITADVDTGVRVGFTAAHPLDGRAAQNLLVRITGPAATAQLNMYIDGVLVVGPIALQNPSSVFTPMAALASIAAAQSNTMYVDWMLWAINPGRTV